MIGDAGNIVRMYWAVKTASEAQTENLQVLSEVYLRKYAKLTSQGKGKRGLTKTRSLEPHFSLARELDLLECKERERWRITFGAGRAFIALWEKECKVPPTDLLLAQLFQYDRSFLIPFIHGLVESDYDFSRHKFGQLGKIAKDAWEEVWSEGKRELEDAAPPIPSPKTVKQRTLLHHANARVRLLNSDEGLSINIDKLRRLAQSFTNFQFKPMPNDYYFRIGEALSGKCPTKLSTEEQDTLIFKGFALLHRMGYASGYGVFSYLNEMSLPTKAVDWQDYYDYVRKRDGISTGSSFRRDDFLLNVGKTFAIPSR
jgi:hypothetical protein